MSDRDDFQELTLLTLCGFIPQYVCLEDAHVRVATIQVRPRMDDAVQFRKWAFCSLQTKKAMKQLVGTQSTAINDKVNELLIAERERGARIDLKDDQQP